MEKVRYNNEPEPVLTQRHGDYIQVTVACNATQVESAPEQWEADVNTFWELAADVNLDDVVENPDAYLNYVPLDVRRAAKNQAQAMLDKLRSGKSVVPVPSYREGAAVCNRAADQIKLLGGLQLGGLPYYELASGEVVALSVENIKAIATDVTAAETEMQQAKQTCWAEIEGAADYAEITRALEDFDAVLDKYRPLD